MHRWQWAARIWAQRHSWWCRLAAWTARVPWGEWRRCWKPRSSAPGNSQFSQALTQGRKLTGSRNIEERKRASSFSACGAFGHWAGDNECPKSGLKGARGKPQGKGNGKEGNQGKDGKVSSADDKCAKRVYFTMQSEHGEQQQAVPADTQDKPFFITFAIHYHVPSFQMPAILFTQWSSLAGMMVLDTACQRMRCGRQWLEAHSELLAKHRLQPHMISISEAFQFGHGPWGANACEGQGIHAVEDWQCSLVLGCFGGLVWLIRPFHCWQQTLFWKLEWLTLHGKKFGLEHLA